MVHAAICALALVGCVVLRVLCCTPWALKPRARRRQGAASVLVLFGSGGHTAEMLSLLQSLPANRYGPFAFVSADTDTTSEPRAKAAKVIPEDATFVRIPRSREVGQSYVTAVWSTLRAVAATWRVVRAFRPDVILVNGPGTCVPLCIVGFVQNVLGLCDARIVFVESVCRVTSMSLTGKLLYWLADQVQVQWPQLQKRYPRSVYVGMLL